MQVDIDEKECLAFLSRLVQFKSYSQTDGEIAVTQFMADALTGLGLDTEICPFDEGRRQNVVGTWRGQAGSASPRTSASSSPSSSPARKLLFNGHLDTNPVSEGWTVDPWEGKVDDAFIYGIGVSNMKSGCAAYFCAVQTLLRHGWRPRADVVLTYVVGELQGGVGTQALISQGRITRDTADYFVNCEPSDVRAITMHAEALVFEASLIGVTRHMSACEEASDAILAACEAIPRLDRLVFRGAQSEDHRRCNRCLVGIVHGAVGRELAEWRPSQVADVCRLAGSARYAPGQTQEDVMADLRAVLEDVAAQYPGMQVELAQRFEPTMPAFACDPASPLVASLNQAYYDVRQTKQPTGVLAPTCFYGSDAGHLYKELGMQGIVCGPGGKYNTRPDEKVDIADYLDCVRIFVRLIMDVCGE